MERIFRVIEDFEYVVYNEGYLSVDGDKLNYEKKRYGDFNSVIINFKKDEVYSYELLSEINNGNDYSYSELNITGYFQEISPTEEILENIIKRGLADGDKETELDGHIRKYLGTSETKEIFRKIATKVIKEIENGKKI